jgi:ubiquinone/menaquinone biosynthesis C-methylase UbiE
MISSPDNSDELLSALRAYFPREGKILDAGCGPGIYARKLTKINDNILCLDLTDMQEKTKNEVDFCLGSITSLPIKSNSIDFIYCLTVLQYIEDDAHAIQEFYRILKPKGKLFITVPTRWSPFWLIRETEIYCGVYPWQSSWNIRPYHYYSRSRIGELTENQFSVLEISGYLYNFFPRLGGLFLNLAKKNHHFNHFFSELRRFRYRKHTIQTSSGTPGPKVMGAKKNQARKRHISKISDLSYHYLIVLEKKD